MKRILVMEDALGGKLAGAGMVTRKRVLERAVELAAIKGRPSWNVSLSDWEEARRELAGEPDGDPHDEELESTLESDRWGLVGAPDGHRVPETSWRDEDDQGRSDYARLVQEGIAGAEHNQWR